MLISCVLPAMHEEKRKEKQSWTPWNSMHILLQRCILVNSFWWTVCGLWQLEALKMDPSFLNRNVNEGFSGGERKRNEILQLAVLEVRIQVLWKPMTHVRVEWYGNFGWDWFWSGHWCFKRCCKRSERVKKWTDWNSVSNTLQGMSQVLKCPIRGNVLASVGVFEAWLCPCDGQW